MTKAKHNAAGCAPATVRH